LLLVELGVSGDCLPGQGEQEQDPEDQAE